MAAPFIFSHEGTKTRRHGGRIRNCAVLLLALGFAAGAFAGPPDLWPAAIKAAEAEKQRAAFDAAPVPPELKPAVRFQKVFLSIVAAPGGKAISTEGLQDLRALAAADKESDPVAHGVAEAARAWIARAEMQPIDGALRQYYRKHVRFPGTFAAIEADLPEALRRDPWGRPWSYKPAAPAGFAKLEAQRYRLGPSACPDLPPLARATGDRNPAPPAWKLIPHGTGAARALEFQTPGGTHLLQPGGKVGDATLLYIGDKWALLAWPDQLFAVTF